MIPVNVSGLGVLGTVCSIRRQCVAFQTILEMIDERARRRPPAHPCANATACLPMKWDAIPVSAASYASPSDQMPAVDRAPLQCTAADEFAAGP